MPDGYSMEFDEDARVSFQDLSSNSPQSLEDSHFAYNNTDVDHFSTMLGIPWETTKTVPFGYSIPYLGFLWDLQNCSVAIPSTKKEKYKITIAEWIANTTHHLEDVQKLYGKHLHTSLMVPARRAYLTNLESMLSTFNNCPFVPHHAPQGTTQDLELWTKTLSLLSVARAIPEPHEVINAQAYSDASSGVSIAITIGHRWRAWQLLPG